MQRLNAHPTNQAQVQRQRVSPAPQSAPAPLHAARTRLGRVTTVFSASNYCGKHANLGAALLLGRAKATALLFEPSACAADVEAPDAASGDEAHFVRQAYLVVPYMPTSFRSLVDTAKELLGLKSFLSPVRARRKRGADPAHPQAAGFFAQPPPPRPHGRRQLARCVGRLGPAPLRGDAVAHR